MMSSGAMAASSGAFRGVLTRERLDALLDGSLAGDARATRALETAVKPVVRARTRWFLRRRAGRAVGVEDEDDLCQHIWLTLLEDRGRVLRAYDPSRGATFAGYIGMIAQRELHRRVLRHMADKRGAGVVAHAEPEQTAHTDPSPEQRVAARRALHLLRMAVCRELPARGQLVFASLYEDGLSVEETAALLGVKSQVVYNWQHRIRTVARSHMDAQDASARRVPSLA